MIAVIQDYIIPNGADIHQPLRLTNIPAGRYRLDAVAVLTWATGAANQVTLGVVGDDGLACASLVDGFTDTGGNNGTVQDGVPLDQLNLVAASVGGSRKAALFAVRGEIQVTTGGSLVMWMSAGDLITGGLDNDTLNFPLARLELKAIG